MFFQITEGTTRLVVPQQLNRSIFYNPRMELCRDIDIASIAAFISSLPSHPLPLTYIDALAGTGARGVRLANEVRFNLSLQVDINDRSTPAYELINQNIALNKVEDRAVAHNKNAKVMLLQKRYDIVDIDPFGSPVPFLDAACQSVKHALLVTATDTAPLCGAHTGGLRNYSAQPLNTEYHAEIGTRILLGAVTRELARYDKAIQPLLSYASEHFIRLIVRIEKGAKKADDSIRSLGFIAHCFSCGNRFAFSYTDMLEMRLRNICELCGSKMRLTGPLYICAIKDTAFSEEVYNELSERSSGKREEAMKIVHTCSRELDIPFFYEYHALCKSLKVHPPPIISIIEALHSNGFLATRTHFSYTGIKTDARIDEIKSCLFGGSGFRVHGSRLKNEEHKPAV
ncbi:MAG: tRNA (guanine(10)-N(2))-dimethyltransferase [Methanophagales archaeon]|nr:tRNA (guanine(10)-N(2))-dimethyltransferase [Methanophagales archaeon]